MTLVFGLWPYIGGVLGLIFAIIRLGLIVIRINRIGRPLPNGYISVRTQEEETSWLADKFDELQDHPVQTFLVFFGIPIGAGIVLGFIIENLVQFF
jgi:hypothetical protein